MACPDRQHMGVVNLRGLKAGGRLVQDKYVTRFSDQHYILRIRTVRFWKAGVELKKTVF